MPGLLGRFVTSTLYTLGVEYNCRIKNYTDKKTNTVIRKTIKCNLNTRKYKIKLKG